MLVFKVSPQKYTIFSKYQNIFLRVNQYVKELFFVPTLLQDFRRYSFSG